jgi:hypothetical protein
VSIPLWYAIGELSDESEEQSRYALQPADEKLEAGEEESGESLCEWAGEDCPFR